MIQCIRGLLLALIIVVAGAVLFEISRPYRPDNPFDQLVDEVIGRHAAAIEAEDVSLVYIELPPDAAMEDGFLVVSPGRQDYKDDEMTLVVPLLNFSQTVKSATTQAAMKNAPGLFEASGMPGEPGANVSIAGHRTRGAFYYLDRIEENDRVYLIHDYNIYTYVFYDRSVVLPSEWSVISEQGFDACTLITCTPIGAGNRRMIVRFILESVEEVDENIDSTDWISMIGY